MKRSMVKLSLSVVLGMAFVLLLLLASPPARGQRLDERAIEAPTGLRASAVSTATSWGSGWISIAPGSVVTLQHNLGGDPADYSVQLWFLDTDDGFGANTRCYGGYEWGGNVYGAAWQHLTSDTVQVIRFGSDIFADRIFVRVWIPDIPIRACSSWALVGQGANRVYAHNLGGDPDDYVVRTFFSSTLAGINHRAYGGLEWGGDVRGAGWYSLTTNAVLVQRYAADLFAQRVLICVQQPDPPAYDSGWVDIAAMETLTLTHGLGGRLMGYRVGLEARDTDGQLGINHLAAGGIAHGSDLMGANWQNLTLQTISVFNRGGPSEQVRVRIWATRWVYLPLIMRSG